MPAVEEPVLPNEPGSAQSTLLENGPPADRVIDHGPAGPPPNSVELNQPVKGIVDPNAKIHITHFAYPNDPDLDKASARGEGDRKGYTMTALKSAALSLDMRKQLFGVSGKSTGLPFEWPPGSGKMYIDHDTSPQPGYNIDVYDPHDQFRPAADWTDAQGNPTSRPAGFKGLTAADILAGRGPTARGGAGLEQPRPAPLAPTRTLAPGVGTFASSLPPPTGATPVTQGSTLGIPDVLTENEVAQHEADAQTAPNVTAKKKPEAQSQAALEEAETRYIEEHSKRLSPDDLRVTKRVNPDTDSERITGSYFVPGDPVNERLLSGVSDTDRAKLPTLETAIARADPFSFLHFSAPEETAGARPTAASRAYEQAVSSAGQRAAGTAEGTLQRVTMIPQRFVVAKPKVGEPRAVNLEGFAGDSALNNVEHILTAAKTAGVQVPYQDSGFNFQRDLAGYIQNQIHGYRGDGQGPVVDAQGQPNQVWQNEQQKPPNQRYIPHLLDADRAMFVNAALNILPRVRSGATTAATPFAQKAQDLSRVNQAYVGQLEGENKLRAQLDAKLPSVDMRNKKGEVTRTVPWSQGTLEPTYRAYRLENIRDVSPPLLTQSIRQTAEPASQLMRAPIAMHTAAEFVRPEPGRPGGGVENPEIGSPETKVPTSAPRPGLLAADQPEGSQPVHTPESAEAFNPRILGSSYPQNVPSSAPALQFPPEAQPQPEPGAYEFVSPNVRENLDYGKAYRALKSKKHLKDRAFNDKLEQAISDYQGAAPAESRNVVGDWRDDAENSIYTKSLGHDYQMRREAAALKGLHNGQKQVLLFGEHPEGEHSLYTLRFNTHNIDQVRDALTGAGIQYRTIEPAAGKKGPTTVHVVDFDGSTQPGIEKLVKEGHLTTNDIQARKGRAEFLGDQDARSRDVAAGEYRRILQEARDTYSQRAGGDPRAARPWFEGLDQEADQSYRDLRTTRELEKQELNEDRRLAAINRGNIPPDQLAEMERLNQIGKAFTAANPETPDLSHHAYILGNRNFPSGLENNAQLGEFIDAAHKTLDYAKPAHREIAADAFLHDIMHSLAGTTTGGKPSEAYGWYNRAVSKTIDKMAEIAPEIKTDPEHNLAFKIGLAVTSQGQDVLDNAESNWHVYQYWKKHGEFPTESKYFGGGLKAAQMVNNFDKINKLWDTHGTDKLSDILQEQMTVRELRDKYGLKVSGESLDHPIRGAMGLGPKVGAFLSNLLGHYDPSTMDVWFARAMNFVAGNMFNFSEKAMKIGTRDSRAHLEDLKDLLDSGFIRAVEPEQAEKMSKELGALLAVKPGKMTRPRALKLAPTIYEWAKTAHGNFQRSYGSEERSYHPDFDTPENGLAKKMDESANKLSGAPRGAAERHQWRQIVSRLNEKLAEHGVNLDNADKQALLWFVTKDLFKTAGLNPKPKLDYLDAAYNLTRRHRNGDIPDLTEA